MRYYVTYTYVGDTGQMRFGRITWDNPICSEEDIRKIEDCITVRDSQGHNMFNNPIYVVPTILCWQRFDEPE